MVISALMLVFLLMLQYAVDAHSRRIAQAAAEDALEAAQAYDGSATAGRDAGDHTLGELGSLSGTTVTVTRTAATADVTVTGSAQEVIPFLPTRISVHLQGPVEHFVENP